MPRAIPQFRPNPRTKAAEAEYRRQSWRLADKRFYSSAAWLRLREFKLSRDPLCESCLKAGRDTAASDVHHVLSRRVHPDSNLDLTNLMSLCKSCHNSMRRESPC